eukprot:gnl/TRDRNA2_/TRDRNA2_48100_c0_seq1.p1 gnl/TRDRNA2_/TRDRNA2_48100_c0~~gnl/TRDRNA2_/TRDRNA2_48100_c0_seq1.p1  ORF type:complete len:393 (-),score=64.41 gnl/TRDRNA2_/TRDRNA2_48100_c0_seq1:11-1189(-)
MLSVSVNFLYAFIVQTLASSSIVWQDNLLQKGWSVAAAVPPAAAGRRLSAAPDFYQVLGVRANDDSRTITRAYWKMSLQHHPDKGGDKDMFLNIQKAYETLRDKVSRDKYDREHQLAERAETGRASGTSSAWEDRSKWKKARAGDGEAVIYHDDLDDDQTFEFQKMKESIWEDEEEAERACRQERLEGVRELLEETKRELASPLLWMRPLYRLDLKRQERGLEKELNELENVIGRQRVDKLIRLCNKLELLQKRIDEETLRSKDTMNTAFNWTAFEDLRDEHRDLTIKKNELEQAISRRDDLHGWSRERIGMYLGPFARFVPGLVPSRDPAWDRAENQRELAEAPSDVSGILAVAPIGLVLGGGIVFAMLGCRSNSAKEGNEPLLHSKHMSR